MSEENIAIVREQFDATNRRDFARPMVDWADDIEVVPLPGRLDAELVSGREAAGEFFGDWFRAFGGGVHFEVVKIQAAGDAVIVEASHRAKGRYSGIEVEDRFFYEYRLREGKIELIKFHESWPKALEAAGLTE
jgi:ketosteroid isomerase-like protein